MFAQPPLDEVPAGDWFCPTCVHRWQSWQAEEEEESAKAGDSTPAQTGASQQGPGCNAERRRKLWRRRSRHCENPGPEGQASDALFIQPKLSPHS